MIDYSNSIDNARDHVRVAWGLVENYIACQGLDKTPREIELAYSEMDKAIGVLEDLDIEVSKAAPRGSSRNTPSVTAGEFWKDVAEMYYKPLAAAHDSLCALDQDYLSIDKNSLVMCGDMLKAYTDKLEYRKDVAPEIPRELAAVAALINKLNIDMDVIRDIIADNIKSLHTEG